MKGLIIVAVLVGLLLLAGLLYLGMRAGGIRRSDYRRKNDELDLATATLDQIEEKAAQYQDIDSVLATDIRQILQASRTQRKNLK